MRRGDIRKKFGSDPDAFHAWYYLDGLQEMKLGIFVDAARATLPRRDAPPLRRRRERPAQPPRIFRLPALAGGAETRSILPGRKTASGSSPGSGVGAICSACHGSGHPPRPTTAPCRASTLSALRTGCSASARMQEPLVRVLGHGGVTRAIISVSLSEKNATNDTFGTRAISVDRPLFPVNIFSLTAFETARLYVEYGANLFEGRYNIGYWPWELTSLPPDWRWVFDLVDEIWAPSDFLVDVYSGLTDKPVVRMPFLSQRAERGADRSEAVRAPRRRDRLHDDVRLQFLCCTEKSGCRDQGFQGGLSGFQRGRADDRQDAQRPCACGSPPGDRGGARRG